MGQMNHKVIRSLSKLMDVGFDTEKTILNMTMDDILALPGITVTEIGIINGNSEGDKNREIYYFFER